MAKEITFNINDPNSKEPLHRTYLQCNLQKTIMQFDFAQQRNVERLTTFTPVMAAMFKRFYLKYDYAPCCLAHLAALFTVCPN